MPKCYIDIICECKKTNEFMKKLKEYKFALLCMKYIPVIMFLLMWSYTIFATWGVSLIIMDTIVGCSVLPSILILSLSQVFKFCWLHKTLTIYSFTVDMLLNVDRYFSLGSIMLWSQYTVAIIGCIICFMLIMKFKSKSNEF